MQTHFRIRFAKRVAQKFQGRREKGSQSIAPSDAERFTARMQKKARRKAQGTLTEQASRRWNNYTTLLICARKDAHKKD